MTLEHPFHSPQGEIAVHYVDSALAKGPNPPYQERFGDYFKRKSGRYQQGGYQRKSFLDRQTHHLQTSLSPRQENPEKAEKGWYTQSGPTCIAWAFVNGIYYVAGNDFSQPQITLFKRLHDRASKLNGLSILLTALESARIANLGVKIQRRNDLFSFPNIDRLSIVTPSKNLKKTFTHNMSIVSDIIDSGGALVLPVFSDRFGYNVFDKEYHAITLVDYRVSENALVEGCVIDPNHGKLWLPMEDIFFSICRTSKASLSF